MEKSNPIVCPVCGLENLPEANFCAKCGTDLRVKFCTKCGFEISAEDSFCTKCGNRLRENQEPSAACGSRSDSNASGWQKQQFVQSGGVPSYAPVKNTEAAVRPRLKRNAKTTAVLKNLLNGAFALVFVLIFALSFCQIVEHKASYEFYDKTLGYVEIDYKLNLKAVDVITLMLDSFKSEDILNDKSSSSEDLVGRLNELQEQLNDSVDYDVNHGLFRKNKLSSKSAGILNEMSFIALRLTLRSSEIDGSGDSISIIFAGLLCLLMIFASLAMAILSVLNFALGFKGLNTKISKYVYFMPALLGLAVAALFACVFLGFPLVGGAFIAIITISVLCSLAMIGYRIYVKSKSKQLKSILSPVISLGLIFIVAGCLFAPVCQAKVDLQPSNRSSQSIYTFDYGASFSTLYLLTQAQEGVLDEFLTEEKATEWYNSVISTLEQQLTSRDLGTKEANVLIASYVVNATLLAKMPPAMKWLSTSYYFTILLTLILTVLLGLNCAALFLERNKALRAANISVKILACIIAVIVMAVTCITVIAMNDAFGELNFDRFEMGLHAGVFITAIFAIATALIPTEFKFLKRKTEMQPVPIAASAAANRYNSVPANAQSISGSAVQASGECDNRVVATRFAGYSGNVNTESPVAAPSSDDANCVPVANGLKATSVQSLTKEPDDSQNDGK